MINFDPNIDNIVSSSLQVKASGSVLQEEIIAELNLPDGQDINLLLENEKNIIK